MKGIFIPDLFNNIIHNKLFVRMGNQDLSLMEAYGRFKTMRRKKRLHKKDKEKQLIRLSIRRKELQKRWRALPLIELEHPYQRGWMRTFVLRADVQQLEQAEFFQGILDKINTEEFSHKKRFMIKRKQHGKKVFLKTPQFIKDIYYDDWMKNKIPMTAKEKSFFYQREKWLPNWQAYATVYSFIQPWRFVLRIKPNMITHTKMLDIDLEVERKEIENYLTKNDLFHKMIKLTHDKKDTCKSCRKVKEKYAFSFQHNAYAHYYES